MSTSPDSVSYTQTIAELLAPSQAPQWQSTARPDQPRAGRIGYDTVNSRFEFYDGGWKHPAWLEGATFTGAVTLSSAGTALTVNNNATISGTTTFGFLSSVNNAITEGRSVLTITGHPSGSYVNSGIESWNSINLPNDQVSVSGAGLVDFAINHNFGGGSFVGGRTGFQANFVQTGAIADTATTILTGAQQIMKANQTWGGTNLYTGAKGALNGLNPSIQFYGTASNMIGGSGIEINYSVKDTASIAHFAYCQAIALANHATAAAYQEVAYTYGAQSGAAATGTATVQTGGRGGSWPLSSSKGALLRAELSNNYTTSPSTVYRGIDMLLADISGAAVLSQGMRIDGQTGALRLGTVGFTPSASGVSIDANGQIGTAVAIAAGGSSWPTDGNTYYATDAYDGVYKLTLTGGAVTGITIYRAPYVLGAAPSNPVSLTPDPLAATWGATGLTANITWDSARTTVAVQRSGGDTLIGAQAAIATNSTAGFVLIPFCAGAPSGAPTNAAKGIALVYDTTNHKLMAYDNGTSTWKGVALT